MNAPSPRTLRIGSGSHCAEILQRWFVGALVALATCAPALSTTAAAADTTVATTDIAELTLVAARDKLRRKEFPAALALFGSAAAAGSAEGQYQYAQMLRNAQGTLAGADLKGACGWLEKAALQGHSSSDVA